MRERSDRSSALTRLVLAVEEATPLAGGAEEQPVHGGGQPDDADMVGEGGGRAHRHAVDAALARAGLRIAAVDACAEHRLVIGSLDGGADCPAAIAPVMGGLGEGGAPQAATGGEEGERLEHIGLAGAILADERDQIGARLERRGAVAAEAGEGEARDAAADGLCAHAHVPQVLNRLRHRCLMAIRAAPRHPRGGRRRRGCWTVVPGPSPFPLPASGERGTPASQQFVCVAQASPSSWES